MIVPPTAVVSSVSNALRTQIMKATKLSLRKRMVDAVTVVILRRGKSKGFAQNIPVNVSISKLIPRSQNIL